MSFPQYHHPENVLPQGNQESSLGNLIMSIWNSLHQNTPPPTLREILGAYNQKGNGDRELLLAMLSAKSSEDQRLAALTQLHQTLVQSQAQVQAGGASGSGSNPIPPQVQPHHLAPPPAHQLNGKYSLLSPPTSLFAPPSPTSMSPAPSSRSSSSQSPQTRPTNVRESLVLPPIQDHLGNVERRHPPKRRRTELASAAASTSTSAPAQYYPPEPQHPNSQIRYSLSPESSPTPEDVARSHHQSRQKTKRDDGSRPSSRHVGAGSQFHP